MDNILIATDGTCDDHYKEVEQVLQTLQDMTYTLNQINANSTEQK